MAKLAGGDERQRTRRLLVLKGAILVALVIAVTIVAYIYRIDNRLNQGLTSPTASCSAQCSSRPAASAGDDRYDTDAFWKKLITAYAGCDPVLFGLKTTTPIEVDGLIDDAAWDDGFETAAIDPASRDAVVRPLVRSLWDADTLYIAVDIADSAMARKPGAGAYCQVALGDSDSAALRRFATDTRGTQDGHLLALDQCWEIPRDSWRAVIKSSHKGIQAEYAFTKRALDRGFYRDGISLPLFVRVGSGKADALDSPVTTSYWFIDSLRGFKSKLMLVDRQSKPGPTVAFCNGIAQPGQWLLQWNLRSVDVLPGASLEIPLEYCSREMIGVGNGDTGALDAQLISPTGVAGKVWITQVGPQKTLFGGALRMKAVVPPQQVPGLYQVRLTRLEKGQSREVVSWPIWIANDWSKYTRQYLLDKRDTIEKLSIDFCRKSILVAHVTKALEMLSSRRVMDVAFLNSLADLNVAMQAVAEGKPPCIPTGRSDLTLASDDGKSASIRVNVPAHYDGSFAWPISCGRTVIPNMINVETVAENAWAGYSATLQESLHIDASRRYVVGNCEEAYLMMDQLVRRPEPWAAGSLNLRMRWTPMAVNARYVPLLLHAVHDNDGNKAEVDDILIPATGTKWMHQQDCPLENVPHPTQGHRDLLQSQLPDVSRWLLRHVRRQTPSVVECVCYGYEFTSKYWVCIDEIGQQRRLASLKATINADSITVQTNGNVMGYTLNPDQAPLPEGVRTLPVIEDGRQVGEVDIGQGPRRFRRRAKHGESDEAMRKQAGKCSSIGLMLADRVFELVAGTSSDDQRRTERMRTIAERISSIKRKRGKASIVSDVGCDERRMRSSDMVLLGGPTDNAWIRRMIEHTPIRLESNGIRIGDRHFVGDKLGLIAIYPNPLNTDRFIMFVGSLDIEVLDRLAKFLEINGRVVNHSDYVVLEPIPDSDQLRILCADQFDWRWKPIGKTRVVANLERKHPDWQWASLLGDIVRQRTGVETFFAHQLLRVSPAEAVGPLTEHDLYQYFFNDWVALTKLPASSLKACIGKLLTDFPHATASGMFHPVSGAFRLDIEPADKVTGIADPLVSVATIVPEDEVALEAPGYTFDKTYQGAPVSLYRHGKTCELTSLFTVDCLVDYLREHPGIELDELLDKQPRPIPKDKIRVLDVLGKGIGMQYRNSRAIVPANALSSLNRTISQTYYDAAGSLGVCRIWDRD